jgi:1-acyl-sn-glycerol-3-phosphate acyltransferase
MTTKAGKTKKSSPRPSKKNSKEEKASAALGPEDESSAVAGDDTRMAERIEKSVGDRLARMENRLERRKKSTRKATSENSPDEDDVRSDSSEDSGVKVTRLRRSASAEKLLQSEDSEEELSGSMDSEEGIGGRAQGLLDQFLSFLPGSKARAYDQTIRKLERMDEFGKGADLDNMLEAFMTFMYKKYWRVETSGLENIPSEGRTLIVSNHSGVLPFDGAMMGTAIYKFHPARRYARFLIEDWFGQLPFATEFMNAVGQVRACQENAERLLRQDELVGVFPEGIKGMSKGFKNRYNLARFGRGGVIRLAIRTRSPVVPCAVVGAEEIYVVLGYANWLGKMLGMPLFPITATFPWLGPLGLIPMPTKWHIQFGEMISYEEYDDSALKDNVIINRLNRQLRATIQEMLDSMLKKRRSLFFG